MKCKNCGTEFEEGVFCPECGTKYGNNIQDEKEVKKEETINHELKDDFVEEVNELGKTSPFYKKWWFWLIVLVLGGFLITKWWFWLIVIILVVDMIKSKKS